MLHYIYIMLPLFYKLPSTLRILFSVQNILLQILACILTYIIVMSGLDWNYFIYVHTTHLSTYLSPAVSIGGLVPLIGLPILYAIAKIRNTRELHIAAWTLVQAAAIGWTISSLYKAFTGRVQPPHLGSMSTLTDTSHDWNFGFLQHGIFWGWPSSHTTVAFAMSFALIALYPKNRKVFLLAVFYAFYIGIGVSMQIHWFSEFVAGGILGAIIGNTVGAHFKTYESTH